MTEKQYLKRVKRDGETQNSECSFFFEVVTRHSPRARSRSREKSGSHNKKQQQTPVAKVILGLLLESHDTER